MNPFPRKGARAPHRSSSDKAALEYLALCGAVPIRIKFRGKTCTLRYGKPVYRSSARTDARLWSPRSLRAEQLKQANVAFGSKGDICSLPALVSFTLSNGHKNEGCQVRRVPLVSPLNELARSKPSDVMSRYSTLA
jgi:hypothetical protein